MNTFKTLWACGALVIGLTTALQAQIGGTLDLKPPGLTPYLGRDIGNLQIGASFTANDTFSINSAGIKFNPFGNVSSQPKTAELDVYIYAVVGGKRGALLAQGSLCVGGACPQPTLLPSSGNPGAPFFLDVPIDFTFGVGNAYLVEFNVKPDGWGQGRTVKNDVEFFHFDPNAPNNPPYQSGVPFTVGQVTVLDGWFNADKYNQNFAHIRLNLAGEGEDE